MEFVEPIRDRETINLVKRILKEHGTRDYLLFLMGINIGLRISDTLFKKFPITSYYKADLEDFIVGKDDEEWLFASMRGGKPITRIQAYRILQNACLEAGITAKIGTHTLRKTFGYHAYNNGYDITLIQKLFNHSSPSVTLRYIGITQEELDDVYLSLDL